MEICRLIRPLSRTTGVKFRRMPNSRNSKMVWPFSSRPDGNGNSPPDRNEAVSPEIAVSVGSARVFTREFSSRIEKVVGPKVLKPKPSAPVANALMVVGLAPNNDILGRVPRVLVVRVVSAVRFLRRSRSISATRTFRITCWPPITDIMLTTFAGSPTNRLAMLTAFATALAERIFPVRKTLSRKTETPMFSFGSSFLSAALMPLLSKTTRMSDCRTISPF